MPDEQFILPDEPNDPDVLDRATAALRTQPVPDGPPPEALRRTLDLLSFKAPSAADRSAGPANRRLFTMKALLKLAVAAVLALALVGVFFKPFHHWDTSVAFAEVLQQMREVRSVKFKADSVVELPGMPVIKTTAEIILAEPLRMRQKIQPGDITSIFDFRSGRAVTLEPKSKTAIVMEISNIPNMPASASLLDALRSLDEKTVKPLEEKEIDGRKTRGFRSETRAQKMTVWADVQSRLPIRIDVEQHVPGLPKTTSTMHDFEWGPAVDDALFDITPPEGYRVQKMSINAAPATEKDLIDGLKKAAELNGGTFPDEFSLSILGAIAKRTISTKPAANVEGEFGQAAITISRGVMFCVDPKNGKDFRYAGAGIEAGKIDAPILWYQPADSMDYHVILSDFSVKTVKPDELPKAASKPIAASGDSVTRQSWGTPTAAPTK